MISSKLGQLPVSGFKDFGSLLPPRNSFNRTLWYFTIFGSPRREEKQFFFKFQSLKRHIVDSLVPGLSFGLLKFLIPVSIKAAVTDIGQFSNYDTLHFWNKINIKKIPMQKIKKSHVTRCNFE